jgi:hypothetical protein
MNLEDSYSPIPSLFIIHEMKVRSFNPFQPTEVEVEDDIPWQDWVYSDGVLDSTSGLLKRDPPVRKGKERTYIPEQPKLQPTTTTSTGETPGKISLALNDKVIADILAASRKMPSWKACQIEGTSWAGTAEENTQSIFPLSGLNLKLEDRPVSEEGGSQKKS